MSVVRCGKDPVSEVEWGSDAGNFKETRTISLGSTSIDNSKNATIKISYELKVKIEASDDGHLNDGQSWIDVRVALQRKRKAEANNKFRSVGSVRIGAKTSAKGSDNIGNASNETPGSLNYNLTGAKGEWDYRVALIVENRRDADRNWDYVRIYASCDVTFEWKKFI